MTKQVLTCLPAKFYKIKLPFCIFSTKEFLVFLIGFTSIGAHAQSKVHVTGVVTDENNLPAPKASVVVKGTNIGTTTSDDGTFSLDVPGKNSDRKSVV